MKITPALVILNQHKPEVAQVSFDPIMAETRFGCGLSPHIAGPRSIDAMIAQLRGPDHAAMTYPIAPFDHVLNYEREMKRLMKGRRKLRQSMMQDMLTESLSTEKRLKKSLRNDHMAWLRHTLLRRCQTRDGFRERLCGFWADHFTARGKTKILKWGNAPYIEEAIRPHIAGRFEDLLIHAATHPLMQSYLDQNLSVGPNSKAGKGAKGVNENLARELLELHTLGVRGGYSQQDVRGLAEILTGLSFDYRNGTIFDPKRAEPGPISMLGATYRTGPADIRDIHGALRALARHPATAAHIAEKLARHFVSDAPDADLVATMRDAYMAHGGDLGETYRAMLHHPASWRKEGANVKQPLAFMSSAMRALGLGPRDLGEISNKKLKKHVLLPLELMGQRWELPRGPDGWPEEDSYWVTPQGMAARVQWALSTPILLRRNLPDPRDFLTNALGDAPPETVRFAAHGAQNRWEGVAYVLASPAFQRHM